MRPPLLVVLALLAAPRAFGTAAPEKPIRTLLTAKPKDGGSDSDVVPTQDMRLQLSGLGWKALKDGGLVHVDDADPLNSARIPIAVLQNASFLWQKGVLVYDKAFMPVEVERLGPILTGLADFAQAAAMNPKVVGAAISGWGIPPTFDGAQILNPDGTATYYGLMLYQYYVKKPDALKLLSYERLSEGLERFGDAYDQAFTKQAPDVAYDELKLAWSILGAPARAGEKPLKLEPYPDLGSSLAKYQKLLEQDGRSAAAVADPGRKSQDAQALAVLKSLQTQKYADDKAIVPAPDADDADKKAAGPSLSSGLPGLLSALDRVNGKPLTPSQQQALIESFPMGELVWRLGMQDLWRQGLTGKGVKVAVIDGGIAPHPELAGSVVRDPKNNFTADRGAALVDEHGTHVGGIIHQLAPDAQITSYVVSGGGDAANSKLDDTGDAVTMAAIRKAVADGNTVINLSLGGKAPPSDPMARLVDELAKKGVIFTVSAGNERGEQSVESPADASAALTVGSLNVDGRMSDFSSFGVDYDPRKFKYAIKDVFMTPGQNIRSTLPDDKYGKMSGTSMAAPALNGIVAALLSFHPAPDPITASQRVADALRSSATPMDISTLPPDISLAQNFIVVNPLAALQALKAQQSAVVGK
jgi:23S rRNA pseudoU1915 N3-methylase RlmH